MRVLYFGNNRAGVEVVRELGRVGDDIVGVVVHPPERRRMGDEILAAAGVPPAAIFDAARLREPAVLAALAALRPDIGVSVYFGYILRPELLALLPRGCLNLHPALLPYNRGAHPNVWSIVEGTPAGVTLHYIDPGVDTGDIVGQREVTVRPSDTGATLYRRLEDAGIGLFRELWPAVRAGSAPRRAQTGGGTAHKIKDLASLDEIALDKAYTGRELIDLLRARTFPPYRGAFFRAGGKKVYVRVELEEGEE